MKTPASTKHSDLLQHGLNLMTSMGISGITIGTLAARARMSKSGLFAHFGSKEDLQLSLLNQATQVVEEVVLAPSRQAAEGLPQLEAVVQHWFGWTKRAGLEGGCPVAAGMFEMDDQPGPIRARLLELESEWRRLLTELVARAVALGDFRSDLDVDQFVWELCGIYLTHHASVRFIQDPRADERAKRAFVALVERSVNVPNKTR